MAETTTYATLTAAIQTWTEDDSSRLVGESDAMIARASDRCQVDLDLDLFEQSAAMNIAFNSVSQTRPTSALRIRSIFLPTLGTFLQRRSLSYIQMMGLNVTGTPLFFHERLSDYIVGPTPSQNFQATVLYLQQLAALSSTNTTNWLTTNAPRLLLYACLSEAEKLLVAPAQVQMYDQEYALELARVLKNVRGLERTDYQPLRAAAGNSG